MTPTAITFLILAAVVIWGGLAASIVRLRRDASVVDVHGPGDHDDVGPGPLPGGAQPGDAHAG